MADLYTQTKKCWGPEQEKLAVKWARELIQAQGRVDAAAQSFHRREPLRFHTSLSMARTPKAEFSLRYLGQEVARLTTGAKPRLIVEEKHQTATRKHFRLHTPAVECDWAGKKASEFRAVFNNDAQRATGHSPEHRLESRFLDEMSENGGRFGGTVRGIRFIGIGKRDFPLQCPLPVSASRGLPVAGKGNIDILARRARGGHRWLSIWELKAPKVNTAPFAQAYVYAVAMAMMLRGEGGQDWWTSFGYARPMPKELEIETVVALGASESAVRKAAGEFLPAHPLYLEEEAARIVPRAALYDRQALLDDPDAPLRLNLIDL